MGISGKQILDYTIGEAKLALGLLNAVASTRQACRVTTALPMRWWWGVASSADGSRLVACDGWDGYVYTSPDSGATWIQRPAAGRAFEWYAVASSSDGMKLVAIALNGYVCTSDDGGATWTERTALGVGVWNSVASSADGTKLVVTDNSPGYLYTSADSGATWTQRTAFGMRNWHGVASSDDGSKLVAVVYEGYIYTSTDSGATWTERVSSGSRLWAGVASSSDGTKLVACEENGYVYTSTDSGATWTERTSAYSDAWLTVVSSSDGEKLVAASRNGYIYTSTDSGATWTERVSASARAWRGIAMSSDGTKLVACVEEGYIYTSTDSGASWERRPNFKITLAGSAPDKLDEVWLEVGDRILVKDQFSAHQNGIYTVVDVGDGASGTWTRADDASTSEQLVAGQQVSVTEGAVHAGTRWMLTASEPITIDTTPLGYVTEPHGNHAGGELHAVATVEANGFLSAADKAKLDEITLAGLAGAGLTTIGTSLNLVASDPSIIVGTDTLRVGVLQNDTQHGARGGSSQHAAATTSVAGFLSAADKTKLDAIEAGAQVTSAARVLTALAGAAGDVAVNSRKITGLGTPTASTDAATKAYADTAASTAVSTHAALGTGHPVATGSVNGMMSAADKTAHDANVTKLATLAAGQAATLGRLTVDSILETPLAVAYAAAIALDIGAKNDHAIGLLTGPVTFTFLNAAPGRQGLIIVRQDEVGARAVTFTAPAGYVLMRDSDAADLAAAPEVGRVTMWAYACFSVGGILVFHVARTIMVEA